MTHLGKTGIVTQHENNFVLLRKAFLDFVLYMSAANKKNSEKKFDAFFYIVTTYEFTIYS